MTRLLVLGTALFLAVLALPGAIALRPDGGYLFRPPGTASLLTSDVSLVPWSWTIAATTGIVLLAAVGWGSWLRRILHLPDAGAPGLLAGIPAGVAALATVLWALALAGLDPILAAIGAAALGLILLPGGCQRLRAGPAAAAAGLLVGFCVWGFQAGRVHVAGDAAALWGPLAEALAAGALPRLGTWADEGLAVAAATLLAGTPEAWGQALWPIAAAGRAALAATVWLVLQALAPRTPAWTRLALTAWTIAGSHVLWPIQGQGFFSGGSPGWQAMHTGKVLLLQALLLATLPRWRAPLLGLAAAAAFLASGYPEAAAALGAAALAARLRGRSPAWSWTLAALLLAGGVLLRLPGAALGALVLLAPLAPALGRLPWRAWAGGAAAGVAGIAASMLLGFLGPADPVGTALLAEARPALFGPDGPTALIDWTRPWPWTTAVPGPPGLSRLDVLAPLALPLVLALLALALHPRRGARLAVLATGALAAATLTLAFLPETTTWWWTPAWVRTRWIEMPALALSVMAAGLLLRCAPRTLGVIALLWTAPHLLLAQQLLQIVLNAAWILDWVRLP